jgi:hypothetical protein
MKNPFRYFNSSSGIIRLTVMMYIRYPLSLLGLQALCLNMSRTLPQRWHRRWAIRWRSDHRSMAKACRTLLLIRYRRLKNGIRTRCCRFETPRIKNRCVG